MPTIGFERTTMDYFNMSLPQIIKAHQEEIDLLKQQHAQEIFVLQRNLEDVRSEYEESLEEGFQEAWEVVEEQRSRNQKLEVELYEEYDDKLKEIKKYIVDKVHHFLVSEWKKIVQLGEDELVAKMDAWRKALTPAEMVQLAIGENNAKQDYDSLRAQIKILEARNIRLQCENRKLAEVIREYDKMIEKSRKKVVENQVSIE